MMIASASIQSSGDPSVGIAQHEVCVEHIDLDLGIFADEDQPNVVSELRETLAKLGQIITGEQCAVTLLDERGERID